MIKKILIINLLLSWNLSAEITQKKLIEAGKPSVKQASKSTNNQLVLAVGSFDPLIEQLNFNKSSIPNIASSKYKIVQFETNKTDPQWLRSQGIKIVSYLPNNAYVIVDNKVNHAILDNNPAIRWQGKYLSNYKISPKLWGSQLKNFNSGTIKLIVSLFNDHPVERVNALLNKNLSNINSINSYNGSSHVFELKLDTDQLNNTINKLSQIDSVRFVEIAKKLKFNNAEAVSAVQANLEAFGSNNDYIPRRTPIFDKGLFGTGQIIGVTDTGLDSNEDWFVHYDNGTSVSNAITPAENTNPPTVGTLFPERKVIGHFVMPGAQPYEEEEGGHGTHVTGSAAGDRALAIGTGPVGSISSPTQHGYDNDDGMAPNAQILFQDIGGIASGGDNDGEPALTGQASSPMWQQAYDAGARIHSNSYGSDGDGTYIISDAFADKSLRDLEDIIILFAAGNDGDMGENTIGSAGNAKNVLTVGALVHGNSRFRQLFSSQGPTDDGRIKPDIMATGSHIDSALGDMDNSASISPPTRTINSGTSMATPITAGSTALLRQYYTEGFYPTGVANIDDEHIPTGPLMKATLINGAGVDGGHFDKEVGWGRVFLDNSIMFDDSEKQLRAWELINQTGMKTGESITFKLGVKAGQSLAITLAWYDVPAQSSSGKTLINDLDLTVEINGQTYLGNVFSSTATSGTGGTRDSINTVEQVRLPNPEEGIYTITVKATHIPGDETPNSFKQGFGLVATGNFDNIDTIPGNLTSVTNLSASSLGDNGIELAWEGGDNADFYEVYRVEGSCSTADFKQARFVGNTETQTYTDFRTIGGTQYAYKIRAAQYKKLGGLSNTCIEKVSEQACDLQLSFDQSSVIVTDNIGDSCHNKLQWSSATSSCPNTSDINYNIYRSEDPNFTPSIDNLLTTVNSTSYDDIRAPDVAAYYIVRAEDTNTNGQGPNGGIETSGTIKVRSQAIGTGSTSSAVFEDVDNVSIMNLSFPWQVVSNRSADGNLSYKTGEGGSNYPSDQCASITTNTISLTSDVSNPSIEYKALYNLEENWDGVVVEISTDDGTTWSDLPPDGGYPSDFSLTTNTPVNACGYLPTHGAFSGSNNSTFESFSHDLNPFIGEDVKIRWRLSTDPNTEFEGFYIDSIQYPNIETPNVCSVNTTPDAPPPGLYYDPTHSGHGFVIEPFGDTGIYFTVFYTYRDDGTAEWFTSIPTLENNVLNGEMFKVTYDYSIDPSASNPTSLDTSESRNLNMEFTQSALSNASCPEASTGVATWDVGTQSGSWCIQPLLGDGPNPDFGGTWWTGTDDSGWGVSLSFTQDARIVATMYYFDANGNPRWVQGVQGDYQLGEDLIINMNEVLGYGRDTTPISPVLTAAGTLTINLSSNQGLDTDGTITTDVTYQGTEGGTWTRNNVPFKIFTQPHN
jgi:fibronectin type 3 domain-containing protein